MALTEQVKVIAISGKPPQPGNHIVMAGPIPQQMAQEHKTGSVTFMYLSDNSEYARAVPHEELEQYRVGQVLTQVTS